MPRPKATSYSTLESLKTATRAHCLKRWAETFPEDPWTDEREAGLKAALAEDVHDIPRAHAGLVLAFRDAITAVNAHDPKDPRTDALREFLGTLSEKTRTWLCHFGEHIQIGWNKAASSGRGSDRRTRLAVYQRTSGRDCSPGTLATMSILLGHFPDSAPRPMTAATATDRERKAMVGALKSADKFIESQTHMDSVFEPGKRVQIRSTGR